MIIVNSRLLHQLHSLSVAPNLLGSFSNSTCLSTVCDKELHPVSMFLLLDFFYCCSSSSAATIADMVFVNLK
jgi:hypothetical protein